MANASALHHHGRRSISPARHSPIGSTAPKPLRQAKRSRRPKIVSAGSAPARFVASFMTGLMMSNDDAVARLQAFCPPDLDASLIQRALECRCAAADPDELFPA